MLLNLLRLVQECVENMTVVQSVRWIFSVNVKKNIKNKIPAIVLSKR